MMIYVSIGNSDDKLTQAEWAAFVADTETAIGQGVEHWHGKWFTAPDSAWQGACWAFEIREFASHTARARLREVAKHFQQDAIAWAEAQTEFISGGQQA